MHQHPLMPQLLQLLQLDKAALLTFIQQHHIQRISDATAHLNLAQQILLLNTVPVTVASQIFERLSAAIQIQIAQHIRAADLANIVQGMHSDDRNEFYQRLAPDLKQSILQQFDQETQQQMAQLATYSPQSAGAVMSSEFVTLAPDITLEQAIDELRQVAADRETLYLIYVVDHQQKLLGVISLRQIIQAKPQRLVQEVMQQDVVSVDVDTDQEQVAKILAHYDFLALPIVDEQQRLLGIVTYDDAMDVIRAETDEDFLKSSAVQNEGSLSLKDAPIFELYKKRVFWLVILVFGSLVSGIGISYFEDIIATHIVLVFFLPLLVGSGGNAGSQSATLMVRALATGDVELKDWFGLLGREALVALCLGATMAAAVSILGYIRSDMMVALVLALSMLGIVLLGALIGMSLPFILNKLKLDPASASGPLVTSICDATGVVVYLYIAAQLLF